MFASNQRIYPNPLLNWSYYFDNPRGYDVRSECVNDTLSILFWFVVNQKSIEVVQDGVHCRCSENEGCITDKAYIDNIQYPELTGGDDCTNVTETMCPEPQSCPQMPLPSLSDGSLKNKSISTVLWIVTVLLIIIRLF